MDSTRQIRPMNVTELSPHLEDLISKDAMLTLKAKEPPRSASAIQIRPMTIAEMEAELGWPFNQSPTRIVQTTTSTKKKCNSSVKVQNKVINHKAIGQVKHNSVRKVLNFPQPKERDAKMASATSSSMNMDNTVTPKFPKPETKVDKFKQLTAGKPVRISGISHLPDIIVIPDTPQITEKPIFKSRMTQSNKENMPNTTQGALKKPALTPKLSLHKKVLASRVPDTPMSFVNSSIGDASFLLNEQAAENLGKEIDNKVPPMSTPFSKYRNPKEFFNISNDDRESSCQDDTIMCFDETVQEKREGSVIVSLCDKLSKANVPNSDVNEDCDIADWMDIIKHIENNIEVIDTNIKSLKSIKQLQSNLLQYMLHLKKYRANNNERTGTSEVVPNIAIPHIVVSRPTSVIKSCLKSPSYKIPKRIAPVFKKKVFYKSAPNVSKLAKTPVKMGNKALSMYMRMKQNMQFLNTPAGKQSVCKQPNTPTTISHNLQKQLDKLYNQS